MFDKDGSTVFDPVNLNRLTAPVENCKLVALAYLVRPVSGSTTLRITLCLASYSSLVRGLLVESRAFCSSVMTAEENRVKSTKHDLCGLGIQFVPKNGSKENSDSAKTDIIAGLFYC